MAVSYWVVVSWCDVAYGLFNTFRSALRQQHPMLADVLVIGVLAVAAASSVYKVDLYMTNLAFITSLSWSKRRKSAAALKKRKQLRNSGGFLAPSNWVHTGIQGIFVCVPFECMRHVSAAHADFDASEHGPTSMWTMLQCSNSAANFCIYVSLFCFLLFIPGSLLAWGLMRF